VFSCEKWREVFFIDSGPSVLVTDLSIRLPGGGRGKFVNDLGGDFLGWIVEMKMVDSVLENGVEGLDVGGKNGETVEGGLEDGKAETFLATGEEKGVGEGKKAS